ncbi:MAG TPA: phage tail sheath subtilisin-like domain-containing protein [Propionicimonas sp.]
MTLTTGFQAPGHPGVYLAPAPPPETLQRERLDIAGFVGVAPRGPVDEPVRLGRWSEFVRIFGGLEPAPGGPVRLLPYAVSAFFRQGGQVAYVVRVAPHGPDATPTEEATATFQLALDVPGALLRAANEGAWGNSLHLHLLYRATRLGLAEVEEQDVLRLPPGAAVPTGSLLRLSDPALPSGVVLRWVTRVDDRLARGDRPRVWLDAAVPLTPGTLAGFEVVSGTLSIDDPAGGGGEQLTGLGLRPDHPRWLPRVLQDQGVLRNEPHLVVAVGDWLDVDLTPGPALSPVGADLVTPGTDRSHLVDAASFFDPDAGDAYSIDEDEIPGQAAPRVGVDRIARVPELGLLCVPDLTWRSYTPVPAPPVRRPLAQGPWARARCCSVCDAAEPEPVLTPVEVVPGGLDPAAPSDLLEIVNRQERVVEAARRYRRFVALLDVPDGLSLSQVTTWRAHFDASYAAAYHPWLAVADGPDGRALPIPPSAFAAGIIAERELRLGLPWGPANELARDAVRAEAAVTDAVHDRLHGMGINVFRAERDGFRLTAARTLSSDPDYRQLSVRRLMTMLRLSLERQTQWLAFEPNTPELRERLARVLTGFLRDLARRGAFAGRTEAESCFVRCGDDVNPPASQALGRLVAEIGVAPAVPLEYILVRIARDPDGSLTVARDE